MWRDSSAQIAKAQVMVAVEWGAVKPLAQLLGAETTLGQVNEEVLSLMTTLLFGGNETVQRAMFAELTSSGFAGLRRVKSQVNYTWRCFTL
jgi:hypothetical protein